MTAPRRSAKRLAVLAGIVEDSDAGRAYRYAAAIEPVFYEALYDGGYVEEFDAGRHPLGGRVNGVRVTDKGRELLARWQR